MAKILIRSGMSPFDVVPYDELANHIGGNAGNLIYAYGVYRMLSADGETELISTDYRLDYSEEEIERFNAEFECFVIPLADAFRPAFARDALPKLTKLVRALRIPCVLVGVGLHAPYEPQKNFRFPFDDAVREFIAAVLEKSAITGLRGEITADYLTRLGFRPERDFTVIGCPSMYTYGMELEQKPLPKNLGPDAKVSFCMSQRASKEQIAFIRSNARSFSDAIYIPQRDEELCLMRTGRPYLVNAPSNYPLHITDEIYRSGNVCFFGSAKSWIDFQRGRDLCFGTRMHGNISAVLAGLPTVFLPFDARTRELVAYHHFPRISPSELRGDQRLEDWCAKLDFSEMLRQHPRNFQHYVDFLDRNGIRHIYRDANGGLSFDEKLASIDFLPPLRPATFGQPEDAADRLDRQWRENPAWRREYAQFQFRNGLRKIKRKLVGPRRGQ